MCFETNLKKTQYFSSTVTLHRRTAHRCSQTLKYHRRPKYLSFDSETDLISLKLFDERRLRYLQCRIVAPDRRTDDVTTNERTSVAWNRR